MPATFTSGTDWQDGESTPVLSRAVQESDCWPVDDRSGSGTKDQLAPGLHPIVAVGDRAAPTRPLNVCGAVMTINLLTSLSVSLCKILYTDNLREKKNMMHHA